MSAKRQTKILDVLLRGEDGVSAASCVSFSKFVLVNLGCTAGRLGEAMMKPGKCLKSTLSVPLEPGEQALAEMEKVSGF